MPRARIVTSADSMYTLEAHTRCGMCGNSFEGHGAIPFLCLEDEYGPTDSMYIVSIFLEDGYGRRPIVQQEAQTRILTTLLAAGGYTYDPVGHRHWRAEDGEEPILPDFEPSPVYEQEDDPNDYGPEDDYYQSDGCTCPDCVAAAAYTGEVE